MFGREIMWAGGGKVVAAEKRRLVGNQGEKRVRFS